MQTYVPPPDLTDPSTGKGLLDADEMHTYRVVYNDQEATKLIQQYYTTAYAGGFRGAESIYRDLAVSTIGISRSQVAKVLHHMESNQISHSANQSILQPVVTTRVMQRLQIDLIDYSKSKDIVKFNSNINYILTCIDCFSKFMWCFGLKNKSSAVVANTL